jgi:hypothetical protein
MPAKDVVSNKVRVENHIAINKYQVIGICFFDAGIRNNGFFEIRRPHGIHGGRVCHDASHEKSE